MKMNKCINCQVTIQTNLNKCPLCNQEIKNEKPNSVYPEIKTSYKAHHILYRILLLISLLGITLSLFINYIISYKISWSFFVSLGIICFWVTFITAVKHRKNISKLLFAEIIALIIIAYVIDRLTGYHRWAIIYVLPFLCLSYTIIFILARIFRNHVTKELILYTYLNSLIGLIPLIFLIRKSIFPRWPSIISIIGSIFAIIFLTIFNHKTLKNEIEKYLHI